MNAGRRDFKTSVNRLLPVVTVPLTTVDTNPGVFGLHLRKGRKRRLNYSMIISDRGKESVGKYSI